MKATSRAVIVVFSTLMLVVANAVGVSAVSSALTGEPDHAFSSDHVHFGDDALELPELTSLSDRLGWRRTQGPGVYDVVVVGVSTPDAPTTATAANSEFVVDQADDMWDSTTNGAFRLDFRDFLSVSATSVSAPATCNLATTDDIVESAVRAATNDGTPRPGRLGLLFVSVVPCEAGVGWGWLGGSSSLVVSGMWGQVWGAQVLAHEVGHNFTLMHSGSIACESGNPPYPADQTPAWPCPVTEYDDFSAVMGGALRGTIPERIPAQQLEALGLIQPSDIADIGAGHGQFTLAPVIGTAPGTRLLGIGTAQGGRQTLEYRPATATTPAGVYLDIAGEDKSQTHTYRAGEWYSTTGIPVGTSVTLADGRVLKVLSTGASARVQIAKPPSAPEAPTDISVSAGDRRLSVAFSPPASTGGPEITNYEYSIDGGKTWVSRSPASTVSPLVISGLTNGTEYSVALRAVNSAGAGGASAVVKATPSAPVVVPGVPRGLLATAGDRQLSVAFAAPVSDGGAEITNYEYSIDGGKTWVSRSPASTVSPLVISGLTNGTEYSVALRAVNSAGAGGASAVVKATPSAPVVAAQGYVPLSPARFVDTRAGQATVDGLGPKGVVGPGGVVEVQVAGRNGVPVSGVGAVAVNITATGSTQNTFLTAWPSGEDRPNASNVNPAAGQTVPNMAIVKLGAGGSLNVANTRGETHVIVDVLGWFPE